MNNLETRIKQILTLMSSINRNILIISIINELRLLTNFINTFINIVSEKIKHTCLKFGNISHVYTYIFKII